MSVEIGDIFDGKITGIMNFGCFVDLGNGESGLCHISEISHDYVKNIHDVVEEGQEVKVKVVECKDGKIALSIKALLEPAPKKPIAYAKPMEESGDAGFEDLMSRYIKDANEKIQSINQRNSRRRKTSKRR